MPVHNILVNVLYFYIYLDLLVVRLDDPTITIKNIPATRSHISGVLTFVFPSNIRYSEFREFSVTGSITTSIITRAS
jgi:hypothetical protein